MSKLNEKLRPVQITWENIDYSVKLPPEGCCKGKPMKRQILHGIRGVVEPGQMLAIMGPSGSGKTTLLNVLSGKLIGKFDGDVRINGELVDKRTMKRIAGFVPQEDILLGTQTVYEALQFYANLKMSKSVSKEEKHELIMNILKELGLDGVKDTIIGYVGADALGSGLKRGLSGGERKRLSIGCQLISNPSLIFLDEPTTGLDSFAAQSVINTLSKLSLQGRTIIFTIHQPSSEISELFDKVLLLGKGRTIFFGANSTSIEYFSSIGYECPSWENTSDFFLNVIHGESKSFEEKLDQMIEGDSEGAEVFDHSDDQALKLEGFFKESEYYNHPIKKSPPKIETKRISNLPGFFGQMGELLKRNFRSTIREPTALKGAVTEKVVVALLIGLIYLQLERSQTGLQNFTGAIFFGAVYAIISGLLVSFYMFPTERKIFLYQNQDGLYTSATYYTAKMIAEIPTLIPNSLVFTVIYYFMIGFQVNAGKYFIFLAAMFTLTNVAFACGLLLLCAFVEVTKVMQVFPIIFIPLMIFSGFYLNSDNTPPYFIWVEHLSFLKYGFRALMNNEFSGVEFFCKENEFTGDGTVCPFTTGDQWLEFWKLDTFPIWGDILILIEMALLLHLIAYILLQRDAKKATG